VAVQADRGGGVGEEAPAIGTKIAAGGAVDRMGGGGIAGHWGCGVQHVVHGAGALAAGLADALKGEVTLTSAGADAHGHTPVRVGGEARLEDAVDVIVDGFSRGEAGAE